MKNRVISLILVFGMLWSMSQTLFVAALAEQPQVSATKSTATDITNYSSTDSTSFDYSNRKNEQAMKLKGESDSVQLFDLKRTIENQISNEYLKLIAQTGTFSYYTTGGDPENTSDNDAFLLYDGTSYMALNINGNCQIYSSDNISIIDEETIYSSNNYGDIKVEQLFSFVYNPYTKRSDTAEFKYVITNNSDVPQEIGARFFFDIMLADNDSAPFKIPGYGDITTETEFSGDELFQVWQSFDNLEDPTIIASGTLYNNIDEKPDKIQFLDYYTQNEHDLTQNEYDWETNISSDTEIYDTAVNIYFNPTTVQPGETKTVKTYYGLSSLQAGQNINLGVKAFMPSELLKDEITNSYLSNPFTINGFVENKINSTLTNVKATLNLPDELTTKDDTSISFESIESKDSKPIAWQIEALPQYKETDIKFSITLSANEVPDETTEFSIHLPRLLDDFGNYPEEKDGVLLLGEKVDARFDIVEDVDYFKFVAPEKGTYSFESVSDFSLTGKLYQNGNLLDEDQKSGIKDNFYIIAELEKDEIYYLEVSASDESEPCNYSVQVDKLEDYVGNHFSSALVINDKKKIDADINYPCDIDMFTFTPSTNGWYTITISPELFVSTTVIVELYNKNFELLNSSYNFGDESSYKLVKDEVYYIKVMQTNHLDKDDAGIGPYTIILSPDETCPTIGSLSPSVNTLLNGSINVSVVANDNVNVNSIVLKYSYDNKNWFDYATQSASNNTAAVFNVNTKDFNDGTVYISAVAIDENGNISINNPTNVYIIDNTPPEQINTEYAISTVGANYISWNKTIATDAKGYILYRSNDNGITYSIVQEITDIDTLFYVDTNVTTGTAYTYKITAYDMLRQESSPTVVNITATNDMQYDVAIKSLAVVPEKTALFVGEYSQISAIVEYINGTTKNVTSMLKYDMEDTLMSVDTNGKIRALSAGEGELTVSVGSIDIRIPFVIKSLNASISSDIIVGNGKEQLSVMHYALDGIHDVTNYAIYTVGNPEVLSVSSTGEVQALVTGSTTVTITFNGQSETISVSVFAPPSKVTSVNVDNNTVDVPINQVLTWIPSSATDKYNIYIWKEGANKPSSPTASGLNATMFKTNFEYNTKYYWQIESVNQYASAFSDIFTFSVVGLPDLICADVTAPMDVFSESEITISWEVKNIGTHTTGGIQWNDFVYLSPSAIFDTNTAIELGTHKNYTYLDVNESYKNEASYTIPRGIAGKYYIFVISNRYNNVRELNSSNNSQKSNSINIVLCPQPDLKVTKIGTSLQQIISGNKLTVTWDVENAGIEIPNATNGWMDEIYFSKDENLSSDDTRLASVSITVPKSTASSSTHILYADKKYTATKEVTIPQNIFGEFYIIVCTDSNDKVYENDSVNNVGKTALKVILDPPADIVVSNFEADNNMVSNNKYTISWTDINEGSRDVSNEFWSDRIYISKSATFDNKNAYLLKTVGSVKEGKVNTAEITIPKNYDGEYYLHIVADFGHKIFEYNTYDNNIATKKIAVVLRDLPDLSAKELVSPTEARAFDKIAINYKVSNVGLGATVENSWKDTIYISDKEVFDATAMPLSTLEHSGNLSSNGEYTGSAVINIPDYLLGTYYFYIDVDCSDWVIESGDDSNNLLKSNAINVLPRLASDLQVTEAKSTGADFKAGAILPITWTVTNKDVGVSTSSWIDTVYLSTSAETPFSAGSVRLGSLRHEGSLAQNESYNASQNFILSGSLNGTYYIYVVTDSSNNVYENENEDNNFKKVSLISINSETGEQTGEIKETIDVIFTAPSDIAVSGIVAPTVAEAGTKIEIEWDVTNKSENETQGSSWTDAVYLVEADEGDYRNGILLATQTHTSKLKFNESYHAKTTATLPYTTFGNFKIVVVTDINGRIIDIDRSNNVMAMAESVDVSEAKAVDFTVKFDAISEQVTTGQPLSISFVVTNIGETDAYGKWYDSLYLSYTQTTLDIKLVDLPNPNSLSVNESYTQTTSVSLPTTIKGPMYLVVKSNNSTSSVYEVNFENNINIAPIELTAMTPVDLTVANISIPSTACPGEVITVSWDVVNLSTQSLNAIMTDNVYISADTVWDINDIPVGELTRNVSLAGNSKYYESLDVAMPDYETLAKFSSVLADDMPGVQEGQYYVIVRTDVKNQVNENDKTNNKVASANTLDATVAQIKIGTAKNGTLKYQDEHFYRFSSDGAESLNVTLECIDTEAINEVYVKYNGVPTAYDYDYKFTAPMSANQQVVIPVSQKGEYYIYIKNIYADTDGTNFDLSVNAVSYGVNGITPKAAAQGKVTVKLNGSLLEPNLTATLFKGKIKIKAEKIHYFDPSNVYATFDLTYSPYGTYSLSVDCNGNKSTLTNCFTIENSAKGELSIIMNAPTSYQANSVGIATIRYKNIGNTDIPAPVLVVHNDKVAFQAEDSSTFTESPIVIYGYNDEGPAGILPPGGESAYNFTFKTIGTGNSAFNVFSYDQIGDLGIEQISLSETSTDEDRINYVTQKALGNTGRSYTEALSEVASYYSQFGYRTNDINELLLLLAQSAMNMHTNFELSEMTDLVVNTGGSEITFIRKYLSSVLERSGKSIFGYGWKTQFDAEAACEDGSILIVFPDGMRFFEETDGVYNEVSGAATATVTNGEITVRERNGAVTVYGTNGRIASITDTLGQSLTVNYNGDKIASVVYPNTTLTFTYAGDYVEKITSDTGVETVYTYSGDYLASVTTENGTVTYEYDTTSLDARRNSLVKINYIDGTYTSFEYDSNGRFTKQQNTSGVGTVIYKYGDGGELTIIDALGASNKLYFDHNGMVARSIDAEGITTENTVSEDGLYSKSTYALFATSKYEYNEFGDIIKYTNPLGYSVSTSYDELGNVVSVIDEKGSETKYSYDNGKLQSIIYSDGTVEKYEYNANHQIINYTDRNGGTILYSYDAKGNLASKEYSDGTSVSYEYDENNNVVSVTDSIGTTIFEYDGKNNVTKIVYASGKTVTYEYDADGRRSRMVDSENVGTNYSYDSLGRLYELSDDDGNMIVKYSYDKLNRISKKTNGNGTYTSYTYTPAGNIKKLVNYAPDGSVNSEFVYSYDRFGNISEIKTKDGTYYYEYDLLKQLVSATDVDGTVTRYSYDATGNRISEQVGTSITYYTTNELNQYITVGDTSYSYDAAGNLLTKTDATGTTTYSYDLEGNLVNVTSPIGIWEYSYNAMGQRTSMTHDSETTTYLYDMSALGNVIAEYNNGEVTKYVHGVGLEMLKNQAGNYYYDFNMQGSVIGLTDSSGQYVNKYSYSPSGSVTSISEAVHNPFKFSGRYGIMDDGNGLNYIRERYYDATVGRFIALDNYGQNVSTNGYLYGKNNYIVLVDLDGEIALTVVIGLAALSTLIGAGTKAIESTTKGNSPFDPNTRGKFWRDTGIGAGSGLVGGVIAPFCAPVAPYASAAVDSFLSTWGEYSDQGKSWDSDFALTVAVETAIYGTSGLLLGKLAEKLIPMNSTWEGLLKNRIKAWDAVLNGDIVGLKGLQNTLGDVMSFLAGLAINNLSGDNLYNLISQLGMSFFEFLMEIFASFDPNDIIGPASYGDANWVAKDAQLDYMIRCENDPEFATAPVQYLAITHELDDSLDLRTFKLGSYGFGGQVFEVPENKALYQTRLDLTKEMGLYIDVWAGIDIVSGIATWTFTAIDPATGAKPTNPLVGFLPVNNKEVGDGEGFVTYTIHPKKTVENGEIIDAIATIVFDNNAPIETPKIFNTVDAQSPVSALQSTTKLSDTETVLEWTAEDNGDGSGYAGADVYVSVNMAPFVLAMSVLNEKKAIFNTTDGEKYEFFVRAKDNAGNAEMLKSEGEKAIDNGFVMQTVETPTATTILNGISNDVQLIELATLTEGADIFYTIDGETPTIESEKYIEAFPVEDNTTVKAIAVKHGMNQSDVMEFLYEKPNKPAITSESIAKPDESGWTGTGIFNPGNSSPFGMDGYTRVSIKLEEKVSSADAPVLVYMSGTSEEAVLYYNEERGTYDGIVKSTETFAEIWEKITIEDGENTEFVYGNIDASDDEIDSFDALMAEKIYLGEATSVDIKTLLISDVNGDNVVDSFDKLNILKYYLNSTPFSINAK